MFAGGGRLLSVSALLLTWDWTSCCLTVTALLTTELVGSFGTTKLGATIDSLSNPERKIYYNMINVNEKTALKIIIITLHITEAICHYSVFLL